jgi:small conductance mechanosensitive channel
MADDNTAVETVTALFELGIDYGLNALGALVILIIGWIVANLVRRSLRRMLAKSERVDATLQPVIANIVRYLILVFVLVAVLAQFGVQTTSVIAVVGAAGLAIGLALQGTMQNIAAGFMLLFLRPFGVGDYIDAGGISGTAEEIGLFVTTLKTPDGVYISVPNSQLWGTAITNYSRNPTRRINLVVGIGYGDDIDRAQEVLLELAKGDERIHAEPAPQVLVRALGESSVDLGLRCWTSIDDYWPLLFDLTKRAKIDIEGAGLSIPYPQRDLHIVSGTDVNPTTNANAVSA